MTEEYAEEYVMHEDVITENDRVPFDNGYGFQTVSFEDEIMKGFKDGFLAGLKAGRPKWHKVADGDLPEIGKPYLVYLVNDCILIARLREDNVWTTNGANAFENVIAWCEIPKYKGREIKEK